MVFFSVAFRASRSASSRKAQWKSTGTSTIGDPHRRRHLRVVEDAPEVDDLTFKMQVWVVNFSNELHRVLLGVIGISYDQLRFEELGLPVALVARVKPNMYCSSFVGLQI
jgi:hypothetical protein